MRSSSSRKQSPLRDSSKNSQHLTESEGAEQRRAKDFTHGAKAWGGGQRITTVQGQRPSQVARPASRLLLQHSPARPDCQKVLTTSYQAHYQVCEAMSEVTCQSRARATNNQETQHGQARASQVPPPMAHKCQRSSGASSMPPGPKLQGAELSSRVHSSLPPE